MSTCYYATVARRDFGDLITEGGVSRLKIETKVDTKLKISLSKDEVLAIWSADPKKTKRLPGALVCREGTEGDWAAWLTTYVTQLRPFSSFVRLITETDFQLINNRNIVPDLSSITWPAAGLILGEVLGASGLSDKALDALSATAFTSTLSFAIFRAAALYPDFENWVSLIKMWESVREVTNQRARSINSTAIAHICAIILDAAGFRGFSNILTRNDIKVSETCRYLIESPHRIPTNLKNNLDFESAESMMHGSREDRVLAFEKFINKAADKTKELNQEELSFMIGYLASRIAPGTIKHSNVLVPISERYPTAMLWYGFCAGFLETGDGVISTKDNISIGIDLPVSARRVMREILRQEPILSAPSCDIGYLELIALSRTGGNPIDKVLKATPGSVIIELLPSIWTSVNVTSKSTTNSHSREKREQEIVYKIWNQLERLRENYKELLTIQPSERKPEQSSLFPSKRRKK